MTELNRPGRRPDYRGKRNVSIWVNLDKNGKQYLTIKEDERVNCFPNTPKEVTE